MTLYTPNPVYIHTYTPPPYTHMQQHTWNAGCPTGARCTPDMLWYSEGYSNSPDNMYISMKFSIFRLYSVHLGCVCSGRSGSCYIGVYIVLYSL